MRQPFWEVPRSCLAQSPLLIFFDSVDELTGSQVCANISGEFLSLATAYTPSSDILQLNPRAYRLSGI
jgi:hypothetical protein